MKKSEYNFRDMLISAIMLRYGERATVGEDEKLFELYINSRVVPPVPTSHRKIYGKIIVIAKKIFTFLFLSWFTGAISRRQERFNIEIIETLKEIKEDE